VNPIRQELRRAAAEIFRAEVVPRMKPLGFRLKNRRLERDRPGFRDYCILHREASTEREQIHFTVEAGIFVHGFFALARPDLAHIAPVWSLAHAREDLDRIGPKPRNRWWEIGVASMAAEIETCRTEVACGVQRDLIPWYEGLDSLTKLAYAVEGGPDQASFWIFCGSPPECAAHAGFLHAMAGSLDEARRCLEKARAVEHKARSPEYVRGVLKRLADHIDAAERGAPGAV
jgi:hypothetical protein